MRRTVTALVIVASLVIPATPAVADEAPTCVYVLGRLVACI